MEDFVNPQFTGAKTPASQLAKVTDAQSHHLPADGATNGAASSANGATELEQLDKLAAPSHVPSHQGIGASDSNGISLMLQAQQESINAIFRQNLDLREQVARLERAQQYEKENKALRERVARLEAEAARLERAQQSEKKNKGGATRV